MCFRTEKAKIAKIDVVDFLGIGERVLRFSCAKMHTCVPRQQLHTSKSYVCIRCFDQ